MSYRLKNLAFIMMMVMGGVLFGTMMVKIISASITNSDTEEQNLLLEKQVVECAEKFTDCKMEVKECRGEE